MHSNLVNTCPNCANQFAGKYCNKCGEKVYTKHDRSFFHVIEEFFHFASHFEGTFFTSLKTIFLKPGKVSLDYCNGIRRKYFKPLSFFLLLVILYLLFPVFTALNEPLENYYNQDWGDFAVRTVKKISVEKNLSIQTISETFARKSEKISKFLLFILIPFTGLVFWLFGFKKRPYFFDNFIFATEVNSFYLIWAFFIVPAFLAIINFLSQRLFHSSANTFDDRVLVVLVYVCSIFFVAPASKRFYGFHTGYSIIFSLVFIVAHFFILYNLYKFILFVVVINQIH